MSKHLQTFLFCLLLICGTSCTVKTGDSDSPNAAESRAAITVIIEPNPDINVQKYKVGIKKTDGAEVTSREAVSTSYTFVVNSGSYTFYAIAYDTDGSIIGKAVKETSVSDGDKISLPILPVTMSAIFRVSSATVIPSCITQVKISIDNAESDTIPYTKDEPIIFDKVTKEGTYSFNISFMTFFYKVLEIFYSSEMRIDTEIIISIITGCRKFGICICIKYRSQPQRIHSQTFYVI